jgi:penicillin-binding protein 1A
VSQVLKPGDVVYVEPLNAEANAVAAAAGAGNLGRHRGDGSEHRPRARDGRRLLLRPEPVQPRDAGDAPAGLVVQAFVYAAALDNGYTPSTIVMDGPIEIDQGPDWPWRPENYAAGKYYGPSTLRTGIELSRN